MAEIRFEFKINGRPVAMTGADGFSVLSANLTYVRRDPARYDEEKGSASEDWATTREEWEDGSIQLSCTGLKGKQHVGWFCEELSIGDEITIRVLGPGEIDEPQSNI